MKQNKARYWFRGSAGWRHLVYAVVSIALFDACRSDVANPRSGQASYSLDLAADAHAQLAAAAAGRTSRGVEDAILRMENTVPGVGGVFLDRTSGQIVAYLKDMSHQDAAMSALRQFASTMRVDRRLKSKLGVAGGTVFRQGQFAFSDLVAWQRAIAGHVRGLGLIAIDADESRNRVRLVVTQGASPATRVSPRSS